MKVLVIGGGGREHALVWKLSQGDRVTQLFCAPGNAGIAEQAECVPLGATDIEKLVAFASEKRVDLTIVGPEAPLCAGIVAAVCVVLAAGGYPGHYEKGKPIAGLKEAARLANVCVFHAGTKPVANGAVVTDGGRVLGVTALGDGIEDAARCAYDAVKRIQFDGMQYRKDIAARALRLTRHECRG